MCLAESTSLCLLLDSSRSTSRQCSVAIVPSICVPIALYVDFKRDFFFFLILAFGLDNQDSLAAMFEAGLLLHERRASNGSSGLFYRDVIKEGWLSKLPPAKNTFQVPFACENCVCFHPKHPYVLVSNFPKPNCFSVPCFPMTQLSSNKQLSLICPQLSFTDMSAGLAPSLVQARNSAAARHSLAWPGMCGWPCDMNMFAVLVLTHTGMFNGV